MELVHVMEQGHDLYTNIICEYRYLMQELGATVAKHIFREQNRVTDALAKKGSWTQVGAPCVLSSPPVNVVALVEADKKGDVFARTVKLTNFDLRGRVVASATNPIPRTLAGVLAPITTTLV